MKSKKQKQEEALKRRRVELTRWEKHAGKLASHMPTSDEEVEDLKEDKALTQVKIEIAKRDINALEKKLGLEQTPFVTRWITTSASK